MGDDEEAIYALKQRSMLAEDNDFS